MLVELPRDPTVLDDRLALLEDPALAERLVHENPSLFTQTPILTRREVLASASRRFGTLVITMTAVTSLVAGYLLTPLAFGHKSVPAVAPAQRSVVAAPLAAPKHPRVARIAHHSAARHAIVPLPHRAAAPVVAPHVAAPAPVTYAAPVVHARPAPDPALEARLAEQRAEIERLRSRIAAEHAAAAHEAALAAAQARAAQAAMHRTAAQPQPAAQAQPKAQNDAAVGEYAPESSANTTAQGSTSPDAPPDAGAKTPPDTPTHVAWPPRGHFPIPIGGPIGPVGGPIDPCTPQNGRIGTVLAGAVLNAVLNRTHIGGNF